MSDNDTSDERVAGGHLLSGSAPRRKGSRAGQGSRYNLLAGYEGSHYNLIGEEQKEIDDNNDQSKSFTNDAIAAEQQKTPITVEPSTCEICCFTCADGFISFVMSLQGTGAILSLLVLFTFGVQYGGPAIMVWGWIFASIFGAIIVANIAEICSAYPRNPGSAYFWVGQLSPKEYACIYSYWTGVFLVIAYTGYSATYAYGFALLVDASMSFSGLGTLNEIEEVGISIGVVCVWTIFAYFRIDHYQWIYHLTALLQLSVAIAITIIVTVTATQYNSPEYVFLSIENNHDGFPQISFILAISVISQFYPLSEFSTKKGAMHLFDDSSDLTSEHITSPMGLMNTGFATGFLGFMLLLSLLFTMESKEACIASENGAFEVVRYNAGDIAAIGLAWFSVLGAFFAGLNFFPVAVQLVYAMARDHFFPFSAFFSKLDDRSYANNAAIGFFFLNVIVLTFDVLEDLDGGQIFYSLLQTTNFSFQISFGIPILLKITSLCPKARIALLQTSFSLGPWSYAMGCVACFFLFSTALLLLLPTFYPVTLANMNFTCVVVAFLSFLGYLNWEFNAKYQFQGPKRPDDDVDYQYYMTLDDNNDSSSSLVSSPL